jgi:hypothetical protein
MGSSNRRRVSALHCKRRIQAILPLTTSPNSPEKDQLHPINSKDQGRGSLAVREGSDREDQRSLVSGFLQLSVHRSEEIGRRQIRLQPEEAEQAHPDRTFQDGDDPVSARLTATQRIHSQPRPEGRILPRSPAPLNVSLVPVHRGGRRVQFQGAAFRPHDSATHLHPDDKTNPEVPPPEELQVKRLSGRLANKKLQRVASDIRTQGCSTDRSQPGLLHQRQKIKAHSFKAFHLPRHFVRLESRHRLPNRGTSNKDQRRNFIAAINRIRHRSRPVKVHRPTRRNSAYSTSRKVENQAPTLVSPTALELQAWELRGRDSNFQPAKTSTALVEEQPQLDSRRAPSRASTRPFSAHRCIQRGLGSPSRREDSRINVGQLYPQSPHQSIRTPGHPFGSSTFPARPQEPHCSSPLRQYNSSSVYSQRRRDKSVIPAQGGLQDIQPLCGSSNNDPISAHPRPSQRDCGRAVQTEPDPNDRVDPQTTSVRPDLLSLGQTDGGPVCDPRQQASSELRVTDPTPTSMGSRRPDLELGQPVCLSVSSLHLAEQDPSEDRNIPRDLPASRPFLASGPVVRGSPGPSSRPPKIITSASRSANTAQRTSCPPEPIRSSSSRVETLKRHLQAKGFSASITSRLCKSIRQSTCRIYDNKWKRWYSWCTQRQKDPCAPSVNLLCEFLVGLFESGVNIQALRGHRSAINSVLRITAPGEILTSLHLSDLVKSFGIERPVTRRFFPSWDLSKVLRSLLTAPYEPLHDAPMSLLTQKTVFLLALASGSRRGEIAAWSRAPRHLRFSDRDSAVSLLPSVEFRAKTQRPHEASRPVRIPALTIAGDEIEKFQCPVRALKIYVKRTQHLFKAQDKPQLFKPYIGKATETKPAHISNWLVRVIRRAYEEEDVMTDQNFKATAHDIRALSTSWAATNGVPMDEILAAASWRSSSVFTSHYLKDMCHQAATLHSLGPVVAARQVV